MDPSALVFVALGLAWVAYLIPKALGHHDEELRSRTVSSFSHRMRVLARREPVSRRRAQLVRGAATLVSRPLTRRGSARRIGDVDQLFVPEPEKTAATPAARRRSVLLVLAGLLALVVVAALLGALPWAMLTLPLALVVGWLTACRVMVHQHETAVARARRMHRVVEQGAERPSVETLSLTTSNMRITETFAVVSTYAPAALLDQSLSGWAPVPVALPTYATKAVGEPWMARELGLDDTGVWSAGHSDADSELARQADAERRAAGRERIFKGA